MAVNPNEEHKDFDSSDTIRNDPLREESPDLEIDEERIHAVQYPNFADRYYLAENTKTTEWHKSCEEPYDLMEEDDSLEYEDIIDEKFDCDPTLDYSFSANDVPSFSDNFWEDWYIPDTPDSPSSIGYD